MTTSQLTEASAPTASPSPGSSSRRDLRSVMTVSSTPIPAPRRSEPRLDALSDAWVRKYRALAAVRPNLAGHVLGAEVELELAGAA